MRHLILPVITYGSFTAAAFGDNGLYEGVFDPESSFIRVVAAGQNVATINGETLRDLEGGISKFVNVMPGDVKVVLPIASVTIAAEPSTHYTVVVSETGDYEIAIDDIQSSPAKANVSFYNLTSLEDVDLFVPAANAVAISDVDAIKADTVAIRAPLTLDFELRSGEEVLASVSQVELKRGAGVSLLLLPDGEGFTAFASDNDYLK